MEENRDNRPETERVDPSEAPSGTGSSAVSLQETMQILESLRKKCFTPLLLAVIFFVAGFIMVFCGLFAGIFPVFVGVICFFIYFLHSRAYKKEYKGRLVQGYLATVFDGLQYAPNRGISQSVIDATDMISMGNTYSSEDYISGWYHDVAFEQSDVTIQQVTHTKDSTHVTTYFSGRWMIFAFNKNFSYDLQVKSKDFSYATRPGGLFNRKAMQAVEMEDLDFNRTFKVYAGNEHEAFYLLTPHLCRAMMGLKGTMDCPVMFCFTDNRLHVALNNRKNSFEPKVFSKSDPASIEQQILGEIRVITAFVDELKLERDLFKA